MQSKFFLFMMASVAYSQGLVSQLSDGQPQAPSPPLKSEGLSTTTYTKFTTATVPVAGSSSHHHKSHSCPESPATSKHATPSSHPVAPPPAGSAPSGATGGSNAPPAGTPPAGTPPASAPPASTPPAGTPTAATSAGGYTASTPGSSPAAASNGPSTPAGGNNTITAGTPPVGGTSVIGSILPSSPATKPSGAAGVLEPGLSLAAAAALMLGLI